MARTELRTAADVASGVAAGLCLRRVAAQESEQEDATIGQAILSCASELGALPPAGVIADLAVLLGGARLPQSTPVAGDDLLKNAVRAYEDDVLVRLATTARFD